MGEEGGRAASAAGSPHPDLATALFDALPVVVVAVGAAARVVAANRHAAVETGRPAAALTGQEADELFPCPAGPDRLGGLARRALATGVPVSEDIPWAQPAGGVRTLAWSAATTTHAGARVAVLTGVDVTEREAIIEELSHRALHDPLTRLPNRTLFFERLRHALARLGRRDEDVAVLFLDLNDFKAVNDRFGHEAGDRLLVTLADRLLGAVRPADTVARIGGDEFVAICEDLTDSRTALVVADRLVSVVGEPFAVGGAEIRISAAVGIAFARHAGADPHELLRHADAAMYEAKSRGGAGTAAAAPAVDRGPGVAPAAPVLTEAEIGEAVDAGGIVVLYQPQIELPAGRLAGVEALARIRHPTHGLLPPAAFLAVAERSDLIVPLGARVLDEVCHRAAAWRRKAPDLRVTVNLSARELVSARTADALEAALRDSGVAPEAIVVDVPEAVLLAGGADAVEALRRMRALGVRVSVHDAGAGAAAGLLRDLPVDELKVDRVHVQRLDRGGAPVVASVVHLARQLDLRTVAEGVESAQQLAQLRSLGCDAGQGFLFAGPQPADVIDRLVDADLHWPTDLAAG